MQNVKNLAVALAGTGIPVLIAGESGTGKEALARHLHAVRNLGGQFVPFFCGTVGGLDAEDQRGYVVLLQTALNQAGRGTLFLKHIHLASKGLQTVVRQMLDAGSAAQGPFGTGPRWIASASEPLESLVAQGTFAADLYFRLSSAKIQLPPLAERADDIVQLFAQLADGFSAALSGGSGQVEMTGPLQQALLAYHWPGNFRELESAARSYAIHGDDALLMADLASRGRALRIAAGPAAEVASLKERVKEASRRLEATMILKALEQHHWNRRRAARTLQISYRALLYKIKEFELRGETKGVQ